MAKFTEDDVWLAIQEIASTKATKDGDMPALFFQ